MAIHQINGCLANLKFAFLDLFSLMKNLKDLKSWKQLKIRGQHLRSHLESEKLLVWPRYDSTQTQEFVEPYYINQHRQGAHIQLGVMCTSYDFKHHQEVNAPTNGLAQRESLAVNFVHQPDLLTLMRCQLKVVNQEAIGFVTDPPWC